MRVLPLALVLLLAACDSGVSQPPAIGYSSVAVTGWRAITFEGNATARVAPLSGGTEGYAFHILLTEPGPGPFSGNTLSVIGYPDRDAPLSPGTYEIVSPSSGTGADHEVFASFFSLAENESLHPQRGVLQIDRADEDVVAGTIWFESAVLEGADWVEARVEGTFEAVLLGRP